MKRSDLIFYSICAGFGIFNNFHGWANLAYVCIVISIAIIACNFAKKYDGVSIIDATTVVLIVIALLICGLVAYI